LTAANSTRRLLWANHVGSDSQFSTAILVLEVLKSKFWAARP
jgi:hypothetical protein